MLKMLMAELNHISFVLYVSSVFLLEEPFIENKFNVYFTVRCKELARLQL